MTTLQSEEIILNCPHCGGIFITTEQTIACAIYRHAVLKSNMTQINPHASKEECNFLLNNDMVYGCAGPFRIIKNDAKYFAIVCEYI